MSDAAPMGMFLLVMAGILFVVIVVGIVIDKADCRERAAIMESKYEHRFWGEGCIVTIDGHRYRIDELEYAVKARQQEI